MKNKFPAYILALAAVCLVGCTADQIDKQEQDVVSSVAAPESVSFEEESSVRNESKDTGSSEETSSAEEQSDSSESASQAEEIHLSTCKVPSWGIIEKSDSFQAGSEYETYRILRTITFEGESVKGIKADVYVISEDFDMEAFEEKWGFEPEWNGKFYEGTEKIPEEYAGMTIEEIKLEFAEPVLKKYGADSLDGLFEVVFVDPTIAPDPAIDF